MALNSWCFCVPLRTGVLIVAVLYLVVNVAFVLGWVIFAACSAASGNPSDYHSAMSFNLYQRRKHMLLMYSTLVLLSLCGLNVAMNSLLVHGVRRYRRNFIRPWIVWYGIFQGIATLAWVALSVWLLVLLVGGRATPIGAFIAFFCISVTVGMILFGVMWFWYACVVSYYIQLAPSDHYVMEPLRCTGADIPEVTA